MIEIIDLRAEDEELIRQVATLLMAAFTEMAPDAWPTIEDALAEIQASFEPSRISRVAIDDQNQAVGWVGGISQYDDHVWELHPLAVDPIRQGQGIGSKLVADLEEQTRLRGGLTLWLGSDDEHNMTSLGGINLYPNVWEHIAQIKNLKRHPYEFYLKQGFVITGVMPDANGPGKPDIFMAKSLQ